MRRPPTSNLPPPMPAIDPVEAAKRKRAPWIVRQWRRLREEVSRFDPAAWLTTLIVGVLCILCGLGILARIVRLSLLAR